MHSTSAIGIFTTDVNLKVTSWNDWLQEATGLSEESVKGKHVSRVIPDIEKRGLLDRFLKVLTYGSVELLTAVFHRYLIKIPFPTPVGKFKEMQQRVTISPLAEEETIHGTLVTIEDITDQMVKESERVADLSDFTSSDWSRRSDVAITLSYAGKTIISEVLRKIRFEHRNLSILSSAMKVVSMSTEDVTGYLIEFLNDKDHELRIYAAQMLGEKHHPLVIEALIGALDDPDVNVKYHAIESLGKLKAFQAVDRLSEIALQKDFFTAFPALDALKNIGENRAARRIFPLTGDTMLGQTTIEALAEIGEADVVPYMAVEINNNSPMVISIVVALARIAERYDETLGEGHFIADQFRESLNADGIRHLMASVETTEGQQEIKSLVTVLGWIDEPETRKKLTLYLGNPETRKQVIDAFVSSGPKVVDILISQLTGETDIVKSAILALGRIGGENSVNALLPLLKNDDLAAVCCGALAQIGDRRAFDNLLELLAHQNASVRRAAIAALNSIGHPQMVKEIPKLLTDSNPLVRESAIRIAGYFGYITCKSFLQQLVADNDINVRIAAIENLPFFEDERVFNTLKYLYGDKNEKIRAAVIRALGQVESKNAWLVLGEALNDPDEWVRYYAVKSIDIHGYLDVMEQMKQLALHDPVAFVRLAAIEYLGHTGGQVSVSILAPLTGDQNPEIVMAAITALGDIHHPDALPPLMALAKSGDHEIRKTAIESIGRRGGTGTAEILQWAALTESDPYIKDAAIKGLRVNPTKESIIALLIMTSDTESREKAISSLVNLQPEMLPLIMEGLHHVHSLVRTAVVEVLLRMRTPASSDMLAQCLQHEDVTVRLAAVHALHKLGNRTHMKKLLAMRNTDPDPSVRRAVEDFIGTRSQEVL